ncbi:hypothetical protein ACNKHW_05840 [Shigella flexneri]
MLEQLRVLWYGEKIHVAVLAQVVPGTGGHTPVDLSAFALNALIHFTTLQQFSGGVSYRYDFPQFFFSTIDLIQVTSFILALIMKAVAFMRVI